MGSRFIRPDTTILTISHGDTITVKRRLNAGERRQMFAEMYSPRPDGGMAVDPIKTGISTILAFLLDWSLTDDDGRPVVIHGQPARVAASALDSLDPDSFAEILHAIEAHETAMTAERAQEKKVPTGEPASSVISPSPDA